MKDQQPHHTPLDSDTKEPKTGLTGRRTSVEQEAFGPGKGSPDPNELTGSSHESPWANKEPGGKRRW